MLSNPRLIILDEPANGLDIDGMIMFRRLVEELSAQGISFLISSHLTAELERTCSHFGILIEGQLVHTCAKAKLQKGTSIEDLYVEKLGGSTICTSS